MVIATNAFGMGIDIPVIRHVVMFGCPRSMESYTQQAGRAGRDGNQSMAHIIAFPVRGNCTPEMKAFLNLQSCRSGYIEQCFKIKLGQNDCKFTAPTQDIQKCACCDTCSLVCTCEDHITHPANSVDELKLQEDDELLTEDQVELLEGNLRDLSHYLAQAGRDTDDDMVEAVMLSCQYIKCIEDLTEEFQIEEEMAGLIFTLIEEVRFM